MTVESSIEIVCSTQELWDFLVTPESAVVTSAGVIKAFRVPGTPAGAVGDQHCLVYELGGLLTIHMAEVVEAEAPIKVVVRWRTMPTTTLTTSTLTPSDTGTTYTCKLERLVTTGTGRRVQPDARRVLEEGNVRLKACAEARIRFDA